jgi:hypothetical protein
MTARVVTYQATVREWNEGVERDLAALGLTYDQLAERARTNTFQSADAENLWVIIGYTTAGQLVDAQPRTATNHVHDTLDGAGWRIDPDARGAMRWTPPEWFTDDNGNERDVDDTRTTINNGLPPLRSTRPRERLRRTTQAFQDLTHQLAGFTEWLRTMRELWSDVLDRLEPVPERFLHGAVNPLMRAPDPSSDHDDTNRDSTRPDTGHVSRATMDIIATATGPHHATEVLPEYDHGQEEAPPVPEDGGEL